MPSIKRSAPGDDTTAVSFSMKRFKPSSASSSKENVFDEPVTSHPQPHLTSKSSILEPTQNAASATLRIRVSSSRKAKATTVSAPPAPKPSATYNMDPSSRCNELAGDPAVQLIHFTPYYIYCRPCKQIICLERRGMGYYAQNFDRHAKRDTHKRALRVWRANGGHIKKALDEEVQWRCVYWKENSGEKNSEVKDKVVSLEDGNAAEALLMLRAGEPKPGCGNRRAVVDRSGEEDMLEYIQTKRKGAASQSRR